MGKSIFEKLANPSKGEKEEKTPEEIEEEKKKNNPILNRESGFLDPANGIDHHELIIETMMGGVEKYYFQILRAMRQTGHHGMNFKEVKKVRDVFDASVGSSFHGSMGQKLSAIQQQAANYLAQIGQMIKAIFPQVRELRILDERLAHYEDSMSKDKEISDDAEIALKSVWIEVVEQGVQNPNSVYSMGTKLGFVTLPDLFFDIRVKDKKDINKIIKNMEKEGTVPKKVRDALAKKLYQYYNWKEHTYKELKHRRKFMIANLKQHYNVVKMYTAWLRPYLKNIRALQMDPQGMTDADLVNAFETSKMQLELLGIVKKFGDYNACVLIKFTYVTLPELHYAEGGQRKPIHLGRTEMRTEPYILTDEQIEQYIDNEWKEDLKMIPDIQEALDALGDDLLDYLNEADKTKTGKEDEEEVDDRASVFEPFSALGKGFKDFGNILNFPKDLFKSSGGKSSKEKREDKDKKGNAEKAAQGAAWGVYLVMKKINGFLEY